MIRRKLGDVDRSLAYAADLVPAVLPTPERRTRAATDTALFSRSCREATSNSACR
jgi:hypothetical protein